MLEYIKMYLRRKKVRINRQNLINTINQRWSTKNCPMCGANNWTIGEDVVTMVRVDENNSIQLGGKITPVVPMICSNCGNTLLINPLVIQCSEE